MFGLRMNTNCRMFSHISNSFFCYINKQKTKCTKNVEQALCQCKGSLEKRATTSETTQPYLDKPHCTENSYYLW